MSAVPTMFQNKSKFPFDSVLKFTSTPCIKSCNYRNHRTMTNLRFLLLLFNWNLTEVAYNVVKYTSYAFFYRAMELGRECLELWGYIQFTYWLQALSCLCCLCWVQRSSPTLITFFLIKTKLEFIVMVIERIMANLGSAVSSP